MFESYQEMVEFRGFGNPGPCVVCECSLETTGGLVCSEHMERWVSASRDSGKDDKDREVFFTTWVNQLRAEIEQEAYKKAHSYYCCICDQPFVSEQPDYLCPMCS